MDQRKNAAQESNRPADGRARDAARLFERFVAIGDSQTEGLHDYYPDGALRGWADRFADRLADAYPGVHYANLAVRGKRTRQIFETQVEPARALEPDLVSVMSGVNDAIQPSVDPAAVAADLERIYAAISAPGRLVVGCTFPLPRTGLTRRIAPRLQALNHEIRKVAGKHDVWLVDLEGEAMAADLRLWSEDRVHLNPDGHARLAAAFATRVGIDDDTSWKAPLPPEPETSALRAAGSEMAWLGRYLAPKLVRLAQGRSSGDGRVAKRPTLTPVRD